MKTISLREPVARALISFGSAAIGKNWPLDTLRPETIQKYLKPTGIHVSKQGSETELDPIRRLVIRHSLGDQVMGHPTPLGHVVASARMLAMIDAKSMTRTSLAYEIVRVFDQNNRKVDLHWAQGWIAVFPDVHWFWLLSDVQTCKPVPWKGVMSMFPVPNEFFQPEVTRDR